MCSDHAEPGCHQRDADDQQHLAEHAAAQHRDRVGADELAESEPE